MVVKLPFSTPPTIITRPSRIVTASASPWRALEGGEVRVVAPPSLRTVKLRSRPPR